MQTLWQDLRYGARMLLKQPGFTLIAVITLALGIGANTTVFSVVDAWLLRPLPFREPQRLVAIWESELKNPGLPSIFASYHEFQAWERESKSFESLAGFFWRGYTFTGQNEAESVMGQIVTQNFFATLGIAAVHGRTFLPADLGGPPVAVLGYGFWQRRFGGAADVIGKTLTLNDRTYTVIGVVPPGLSLPSIAQPDRAEDIWVLLKPDEPSPTDKPFGETPEQGIGVVARLKPGVAVEQARAELNEIKRRVDEQFPTVYKNYTTFVANLQRDATRSLRPTLLVLAGAVGFVLLIACTNVAGLLLARVAERRKELAVRTALGAGRFRLVRQLLTESLLLALGGAAGGLLLAHWGLHFFLALNPFEIPAFNAVALNYRVLAFTALLSLFTAALFGVIPAFQAARLNVNELLKESARGGSQSLRQQRARSLLVVMEVALSLVLLTGAGLMIRSFARLLAEPVGFYTDGVITLNINLPAKVYRETAQPIGFYDRLLERIHALPAVQTAAVTTVLPLYSGNSDEFTVEGRPAAAPGDAVSAGSALITANYFSTVGMQLRTGRLFDERDREQTEAVAIINETLARRFFPSTDPLGQRIKQGGVASKSPWRTIVGVVGDTKGVAYGSLGWQTHAMLFVPHRQAAGAGQARRMWLVIRPAGDPLALTAMIGNAVKVLDQNLPALEWQTIDGLIARQLKQPRLQTLLSGGFALIALLLAASGLYGVISYSVIQRTHEIGIRMALGAQARDVLKLVIGQGVKLVLVGIALGLGAALLLARSLKTLLFSVSATDPLTFAGIALLLGSVALLACWLPARRATRVDPLIALRCE
jgi:putative ABC transport system permease protein